MCYLLRVPPVTTLALGMQNFLLFSQRQGVSFGTFSFTTPWKIQVRSLLSSFWTSMDSFSNFSLQYCSLFSALNLLFCSRCTWRTTSFLKYCLLHFRCMPTRFSLHCIFVLSNFIAACTLSQEGRILGISERKLSWPRFRFLVPMFCSCLYVRHKDLEGIFNL